MRADIELRRVLTLAWARAMAPTLVASPGRMHTFRRSPKPRARPKTNWRAYLSTTEPGGVAGVNARDRIGKGPWQNAKGVVVAKSVEDLHTNSNNINKQTALTENGDVVSGRGDAINMHDILTGSEPQGLYSTAGGDTTCGN